LRKLFNMLDFFPEIGFAGWFSGLIGSGVNRGRVTGGLGRIVLAGYGKARTEMQDEHHPE